MSRVSALWDARPIHHADLPPHFLAVVAAAFPRTGVVSASGQQKQRKSESSGSEKVRSSILISAQPNDKLQHD